MKKLISASVISICLLLSASVYAQRGDRENRYDRRNGYEKLELTDSQKKEMKSINEDFRTKMKELRDDKNVNDESRKEKVKELRTAQKDKINNILTDEQKSRLEKIRKDRPNRGEKGRAFKKEKPNRDKMRAHQGMDKKRNVGQNRENMMKHVDLTDAQKQQMKSIREKYADKQKELRTAQKNEITSVLTTQQQAKLKQVQTEKIAQHHKITVEGANKLMALNENFAKEKQAIKMSRIAPDAQKDKIKTATEKYKGEIKELKKKYQL